MRVCWKRVSAFRLVQELASDERLEVAHGCVLALEAESVLNGAGGRKAFVDFVEEGDVVENLLLFGGGWTGFTNVLYLFAF